MPRHIFADNPHWPYIDNPRPVIVNQLDFGDVIIFTYDKKERMVFVLAPNYEDKLHGLDMSYIGRGDLISVVIPPMYKTGNPYTFYHSMPGVRNIIIKDDCYRSYNINKIKGIMRVTYDAKSKSERKGKK